MLSHFINIRFYIIILWIRHAKPMALLNKPLILLENDSDSDIVEYVASKPYLPIEKDLPKSTIVKSVDNDVTYLLSKLSDEELIKLLNEQPKKIEYDLNDLVKVAVNSNSPESKYVVNLGKNSQLMTTNGFFENQNNLNNRQEKVPENNKPEGAFFRLENKQVDPFAYKNDADSNYIALQKLKNLLHSRPLDIDTDNKNIDEEENNELLFDLLVNQLKTLCCKKSKSSKKKDTIKYKFKALLNELTQREAIQKDIVPALTPVGSSNELKSEHMFLIINDEIKSNGSEDLISVDPESLSRNSSVLLLGPITTPLTEVQLKLVMNRIANELSKPEYLPLLQQLSDGVLSDGNLRIMNSLITGPETRRYIKPHRCNHRSKLTKVYGGPKWLICTGYLNINTPSLYD